MCEPNIIAQLHCYDETYNKNIMSNLQDGNVYNVSRIAADTNIES